MRRDLFRAFSIKRQVRGQFAQLKTSAEAFCSSCQTGETNLFPNLDMPHQLFCPDAFYRLLVGLKHVDVIIKVGIEGPGKFIPPVCIYILFVKPTFGGLVVNKSFPTTDSIFIALLLLK